MQEIAKKYKYKRTANNESHLSYRHPKPPELSSRSSAIKESSVNSVKRLHDKQQFSSSDDNASNTIKAIFFHLPLRN